MKQIQRAVESRIHQKVVTWMRERAIEARVHPFVWIAAANRMQDKTVGLPPAIHHVPITRDTTDAHANIQNLNFA